MSKNPVNYAAVSKAVITVIVLVSLLVLFVLGNVFFAKFLWIGIAIAVATAVVLLILINMGLFFYKSYHPNYSYDELGKWVYKEEVNDVR